MPRSRRAAALRSAAATKQLQHKETQPFSTPPLPTRRPRRASLRTAAHVARQLSRRRTDFERIAAHHVASLRPPPSPVASAPASETPDPLLTGEWALSTLDCPPEEAAVLLCALLRRLQRIGNLTEGESSDDDARDLRGLVEVLATDRFMSHQMDRVRLYTACCLAELLRICAPEPPVSSRKLNEVCSLFVEQLAVIASPNDQMESFRFSLLEQLATVKTFVIFCDEHDVVCDIFACVYAVSRPHQPAKVRQYLGDILVSLLDEMETIDKPVLDALLAPLVPGLKYSPSAVAIAERVIYLSRNVIQLPLCSLLNASIRTLQHVTDIGPHGNTRRKSPAKRRQTDESSGDTTELSEHHDHISDLLVSINRVAAEILIYVIPNLEDRIRSADAPTRLGNVHLLARLFTSRADMIESYPSLFAEFLTRHVDVEPLIRAEVCTVLPDLMIAHRRHCASLDKMLRDRIMDKDENVRVVAVVAVGKAVDVASDELLQGLVVRLRDRKSAVRKEALRQIATVYREKRQVPSVDLSEGEGRRIASDLPGSEDASKERGRSIEPDISGGNVPRESIDGGKAEDARIHRLSWLPGKLIQAHIALRRAGDFDSATEIERVIFEGITDLKSDDPELCRERTRRFALFLSHLGDSDLVHFSSLVQERNRARDILREIAEYRLKSRKAPGRDRDDDKASAPAQRTFSKRVRTRADVPSVSTLGLDTVELQNFGKRLSKLFPGKVHGSEGVLTLCMTLVNAVDLRIYNQIMKAIDLYASTAEYTAACKDAVARVGSKSAAGLFLREYVFSKCRPGIFSSSHFAAACDLAEEESSAYQTKDAEDSPGQASEGSIDELSAALCGSLRYLDIASKQVAGVLEGNVPGIRSLAVIEIGPSDDASSLVTLCGLQLISRLSEQGCKDSKLQDLYPVLEGHMLAKVEADVQQSAALAKWASRAAICLNEHSSIEPAPLSGIASSLSQSMDAFSGDLDHIVAPVTALSQLAKYSPQFFKSLSLESFDFARALLCGSLNSKIHRCEMNRSSQQKRKTRHSRRLSRRISIPARTRGSTSLPETIADFRTSCMAEVVQRSVKLLVYGLRYVNTNNEELTNLIEVLLDVTISKDGDVFRVNDENLVDKDDEVEGDPPKDEGALTAMRAICRLAASRAILYLARHPNYFRQLSPGVFISTVLCAQDEHPDVRIAFAKSVYNLVWKKRLPLRWIVSLSLMAIEPDRENLAEVRSMMTSLFRYRRRLFENARREGSSTALQLLPESTIAELIWVLANLPDVELDQKVGFPESERCLDLHIDRLLTSNDYAGVLNEFIESLSIAQDATEEDVKGLGPKTERIGLLARIAGAVLKKKQAGRKWNLSEHSGQISLPRDMFRVAPRNVETSGAAAPSLLAVAQKYDEDKGLGVSIQMPREVVTRTNSKVLAQSSASKALNLSGMKEGREDELSTVKQEPEESLYETKANPSPTLMPSCPDGNASVSSSDSHRDGVPSRKRLSVELFEASSTYPEGTGSLDPAAPVRGEVPYVKKPKLSPISDKLSRTGSLDPTASIRREGPSMKKPRLSPVSDKPSPIVKEASLEKIGTVPKKEDTASEKEEVASEKNVRPPQGGRMPGMPSDASGKNYASKQNPDAGRRQEEPRLKECDSSSQDGVASSPMDDTAARKNTMSPRDGDASVQGAAPQNVGSTEKGNCSDKEDDLEAGGGVKTDEAGADVDMCVAQRTRPRSRQNVSSRVESPLKKGSPSRKTGKGTAKGKGAVVAKVRRSARNRRM